MSLSELASLAVTARSLRTYRTSVLEKIRQKVSFDAALYHSLSPSVPLETGVIVGLEPSLVAESMKRWDEYGNLFGAIRDRANREGVATEKALPRGARPSFLKHVTKPFGQRALCMCHLIVRGRSVAALALFSRRASAFTAKHVAELQHLLPTISAGDALHQLFDVAPLKTQATRLACDDQRLTRRQQEVVEHVALGHTNAQIGDALGLSPHSVRNHLARVFARLGAANRADVVRLAVLSR